MKNQTGPRITIGLQLPPFEQDGVPVLRTERIELDLSTIGEVAASHVGKVLNDAQILHDIVAKNPDGFRAVLNDVSAGRLSKARATARTIGISEEQFQQEGGGAIWLAIAVGVAVFLYATEAN